MLTHHGRDPGQTLALAAPFRPQFHSHSLPDCSSPSYAPSPSSDCLWSGFPGTLFLKYDLVGFRPCRLFPTSSIKVKPTRFTLTCTPTTFLHSAPLGILCSSLAQACTVSMRLVACDLEESLQPAYSPLVQTVKDFTCVTFESLFELQQPKCQCPWRVKEHLLHSAGQVVQTMCI